MDGKDIRKERIKRNLTQAQLAEKIGTTQAHINKWENDRCKTSWDYHQKLEKFFADTPVTVSY